MGQRGAIEREGGQRRAEHRGRFGGVSALVGAGPVEADGERRDRLAPLAAATTEDDRRIQAAADVAHHRHIAPEPALDRLHHQAFELLDHRRRIIQPALRARVGEVEVPVTVLADATVAHAEEVARRQRDDPLEKRARRAGAEKCEQVIDAPGIGTSRDQAGCQQRLDLRRPEQPAVDLGVVERANADAVAAKDQRPVVPVPERNGELAARLLEHRLAAVLVEMDPGLGVAASRQPVPARQQLLAQLRIFEELAVERDPDRVVLVGDRLAAAGEVDDRQPASAQRHPGLDVHLFVVRSAMGDRPGHGEEAVTREFPRPSQVDGAGDATHGASSGRPSRLRQARKDEKRI